MKPQLYQLKRYRKRKQPFKEFYELRINHVTVSSCYLWYEWEGVYRLYGVITKPEYCYRGYAYHMLYRILHSHRMRGKKVALTSSSCAEHLYENLGFTRVSIMWPEYEIQL